METIDLNKLSLERLIKKKKSENDENNIDDDELINYNNLKQINNELEKIVGEKEKFFKNIDKYDDFNLNVVSENYLKYFVDFNNQKLEIDNTSILESKSKVIVFSNKLDDK